jgi:ACS family hexuronate transporter-like MFS transporter
METKPDKPQEAAVNPSPSKMGRFRWAICALLFFAALVNYMDRQVLGLLKPFLSQKFEFGEEAYGNIVVAFQASYAIGQTLAGPFIEFLGTKVAYSLAVVLWSLAAMSHTLARSALGLGFARFGLGIGESVNFPASIRTVAEWFPQRERSVATGLFNSGCNVGAIVAPLLVPLLFVNFGWKAAFLGLAAADFVWLCFWLILYDPPEKSKRVGAEELAHIQGGKAETMQEKIPWRKLFGYREAWAYWATCILVGPVWWFYLFWLPDIFHKQFSLDLRHFGPPLAMVYLVAALGSISGGGLSAWFLRRGWSVNAGRKIAALICACSTVPVISIPHIHSVWLATAFFALANAAHQGWSATMYTVVSDIFPKRAVASVVGFGGTCAAVASMGFSWLVGHILQGTGVYDKILLACGSAYVVALLLFHIGVPRIKPVSVE